MEILSGAVGKIVELITERLVRSMGRQIGYLVHYKENIEKLDEEIKELCEKRESVQGRVNEATNTGGIVENDVCQWLTKVDGMKEEVDVLLGDKIRCYNFSSRYRVSKEAKKKTDAVIKIKDDGNFDRIAHPEFGFQYSADYVTFDSRDSIFNEIMEALKDNSVNLIGIYGIGGVGKTAMVVELGKQLKEVGLFDEVVMAVVSQNVNVRNIQGQLADKLVVRLQAETEKGRAGELWYRLNNGKQNLVILDDVWKELKLNALGIPISGTDHGIKGGCNCKVVLTSRNQGVCQKMQVQKYFPLGVLRPQESWALFKKMVGNSVDSPQMHSSTAEKVCKECGGLPVAILAVAAALKDKDEPVWADALQQLQHSMLKNIEEVDTKVYSSLELSYNYLQHPDAKWCFLLCCLFREDAEISIDDLMRYAVGMKLFENTDTLESARNRVHTLVGILKTSCLLLQGSRDPQNNVKMHDVIRDVAISIAKDNEAFLVKHAVHLEEWPEKDAYERCKVISLRSEDIDKFPDELECLELHTLVLERSYFSTNIPDAFFNKIRELKVLDLSNIFIRSLPSSLTNRSNLRMLCLYGLSVTPDISILKDLKNLEILSLRGVHITRLAPEIRQLTRLRLLDLKDCYYLEVIPPNVISSLHRLEELYMPPRFDKWEVEATNNMRSKASIVELESLPLLTSLEIHIPKHVAFLLKIPSEKLSRFKISVGSRLYVDEDDDSLTRVLKLEDIPLKDELKVLLERIEALYLKKLKGLETFLHNRERGQFTGLKLLKVAKCDGIKYLFSPSIARGLVQLRQLQIEGCENMEEIIGSYQREGDEEQVVFQQLKIMKLSELPSLRSFYPKMMKSSAEEGNPSTPAQTLFNEKVAFPSLERLNIRSLDNIKEIWDDNQSESFSQLRVLRVIYCPKLVNYVVPSNMLPRLQNLEELSVTNCASMISPVEGLNVDKLSTATTTVLPRLRELILRGLHQRTHMSWLNKKEYSGLTTLWILNCNCLRNVFSPSIARNLAHLQKVKIVGCPKMEEIVTAAATTRKGGQEKEEANDEIIVFPQLKELYLANLPSLQSFCSSRTKEEDKEKVKDEDIPQAQPFFNHKFAFPVLEELHLNDLHNAREACLGHLPPNSFCKAKVLKVKGCHNITTVVSANSMQRLQNLEKFRLEYCNQVRVVFDLEGLNIGKGQVEVQLIFRVRILLLDNLPALDCLWNKDPNGILSFRSLKKVILQKCGLLRNLFSSFVARTLEQLRTLAISSCGVMEEIVANEGSKVTDEIVFPRLKFLLLANLPNLTSFCSANYAFNMPSLRKAMLKNCPKMQTFTSGQVRMPKIKIYANEYQWLRTEDLNKYVQQQVLKGKGLAMDDDEHYDYDHDNDNDNDNDDDDDDDDDEEFTFDDGMRLRGFIKVPFSAREKLCINNPDELKNILDSEVQAKSFGNVKVLEARCIDKELTVFLSNLLPSSHKLEELFVENCQFLEEVFHLERLAGKENALFFTQLRNLKLWNLPSLMQIWNNDANGILGLQNLRKFDVLRCGGLKNLIATSVARCLVQLEELKVHSCDMMEEIVASETVGEGAAIEKIKLPGLKHLELVGLSNLISFHSGKCTFEWPILETLKIECCPLLMTFPVGFLSMQESMTNKVVFRGIKKMHLIRLKNFEEIIWHGPIPDGSFCDLQMLEVDTCSKLLHVFPSKLLSRLEKLEKLTVQNCDLLEDIFGFGGIITGESHAVEAVLSRLSELVLTHLPKLMHLVNRDFAGGVRVFSNLKNLKLCGCDCLRNLFPASIASCLGQLKAVEVVDCKILENIIVKEKEGTGKISLSLLKSMVLEDLPSLTSFSDQESCIFEFPSLITLRISNCPKMKSFSSGFCGTSDIDATVPFFPSNMLIRFQYLKKITVDWCDSRSVFDLEGLVMGDGQGALLPQLRELVLTRLPKVVHMLNKEREGNIPLFRNLRSLQVINCDGLANLFSLSTATNLVQLQTLKIFGCKVMEEVITVEGGESMNKIVFPQLKCLILKRLPSVTCFSPASNTFEWPSLETMRVTGIPKMKIFASGSQSTPNLKAVNVTFNEKCWKEDLNTTIQHLYARSESQTGEPLGQRGYTSTKELAIPDLSISNHQHEEFHGSASQASVANHQGIAIREIEEVEEEVVPQQLHSLEESQTGEPLGQRGYTSTKELAIPDLSISNHQHEEFHGSASQSWSSLPLNTKKKAWTARMARRMATLMMLTMIMEQPSEDNDEATRVETMVESKEDAQSEIIEEVDEN